MPNVPPDQFNFCGPTYQMVSPLLDAQRCINLYPDPGIASSKSPFGLVGRPGLSVFGTPGTGAGHSLWAGDGRLFAAQGGHVFEMTNTGTVLTDYGAGLNVGTPSPAPMVTNNQQLLICDPVLRKIFYINPVGPALTFLIHGKALEYLDGFHVIITSDAELVGSNPNQINCSNFLDSGKPYDGTNNPATTSWEVLNYALRTGTADAAIQLCVINSLLWILGEKSIEAWYNAGNQGFPFARVQGSTIGIGCLAPASVVKYYNTFLWLGADDRGYAQVYMMRGMAPQRVSNAAIEAMIAAYVSQVNLPFAKGIGYQEAGHTFYCLLLCNGSYQCSQMLVYDLTTGLWHERSYGAGFSTAYPTAFASVANFGASIPNFIINQAGAIKYQSITYPSDDGTNITYTRASPHVTRDNLLHRYNRFELDADIGTANPILDYSNDGGRTFLGLTTSLVTPAADQITPGTFQRFYAQQLGPSRDRVFKTTITDKTNLIRISNALLNVD